MDKDAKKLLIFGLIFAVILVPILKFINFNENFTNAQNLSLKEKIVISSFVKKSLPSPQKIKLIRDYPGHDLQIFEVPFGPAQDCSAGCFWNKAVILRHNEKIGLVATDLDAPYSSTHVEDATKNIYDIDSNDTFLFSQEFYDSWGLSYHFFPILQVLIKDTDTPEEAIVKIDKKIREISAGTGMRGYFTTILLDNLKVQNNREILESIKNLTGDPRAVEYLNKLS